MGKLTVETLITKFEEWNIFEVTCKTIFIYAKLVLSKVLSNFRYT